MPIGKKIVPVTVNTDLSANYMDEYTARFIKNLTTYASANNSNSDIKLGQNILVQKSLLANKLYAEVPGAPDGENLPIGTKGYGQVNRVYVFVWNSKGNHFIYRINGKDQTVEMVKVSPLFNFQLSPEYFIHNQGSWLEVLYSIDPSTGKTITIEDLYWTDGFNYLGYTRVNDCIATNGFDSTKFPYFKGKYDPSVFFRMGFPTPKSCISVVEIPRTPEDQGLTNTLLFNPWQFRIRSTDVFGRPSEHAIISDLYIPGINDCLGSNQSLPRCLSLIFDAGNPLWDSIDIEYSTNNGAQWTKTDTLFLYNGSPVGKWWTRERNANVVYDPVANQITYMFCADGEQNAIPTSETNRLENPIPKRCQSLNKIATLIGTGNNVDGFNPLSSDVIKNISVDVIPPSEVSIITRSITIYVPIHCPIETSGGFIHNNKNYGSVFGGPDTFVFGQNNVNNQSYAQYFPTSKQSGFPGYLNGGNLAISTQVYIDDNGNLVDDINHQGIFLNKLTFQKFSYTDVRPGIYLFRLASHLSDPTTSGPQVLPGNAGSFNSYTDTSTTVWGVCPLGENYSIDIDNRNSYQELKINVCEKDYDTFLNNPDGEILVIASISSPTPSYADFNYIYESLQNNYPVELIKMPGFQSYSGNTGHTRFDIPGYSSLTTDFNGFGWQASINNDMGFMYTYLYKCMKNSFVFNTSNNSFIFSKLYLDQVGTNSPSAPPGQPTAHPDYSTVLCNRIIVEGYVMLKSNNNIGVPGILVVLSRGQSAITDDAGYYKIIAHDDVSNVDGIRTDVVVLSGTVCNYKNFDGGCIPDMAVIIQPCNNTECDSDNTSPRVFIVPNFSLLYLIQKGLLSGGTYGVGIVCWDWLGRNSFVQFIKKITIPTITQSKTIGPSQVKLNIKPGTLFPKEFEYLTVFITEELTISDYITWIVDRFDLIDNTGNVNNDAPSQIRIYYSSLNQYNKENNFNTTTNWNFLEPIPQGQVTGSQQPFTNDVVNFWLNGDGSFYFNNNDKQSETVKAITALVKYDQSGQYFLIDYTSDLAGLKADALIRLSRPRSIVNEEEPYYELCDIIELENGVSQEKEIVLNAFDTYYPDRQIPVPVPVNPTPTISQIATTAGDVTTYTIPVPIAEAIELRTFAFSFEHDSPSNFWGKGAKNIGRTEVVNPYESEIVSINQIALGAALLPNGRISYLQYFDDANKYIIPVQNTGGIVSMFFRQGRVFCICQYGKFLVGYNDNAVRVDATGAVTAPSAADKFGNPEVDLKNDYGCQIVDKSTIMEIDGLIIWVDSNKGELVRYDFSEVSSFTKDDTLVAPGVKRGRHDAAFMTKVKSVQSSPTRYFIGGIDPIAKDYLLTDFDLTNKSYINSERTYVPGVNETIRFDINTKDFKGWFSFTPERYAHLYGDLLSNQLFTFKGAMPYSHYNVNENTTFGTFYGVVCERIFTLCVADEILKKKKPDWLELYGINCGYFVDDIINDSGQSSRILRAYFKQGEFMYSAPFLRDQNTPTDTNLPASAIANKLIDGNPLFGEWFQIRFVSFGETNNQYSELTGVMIFITGDSNTGDKRGVLKKQTDTTT